MQNNVELIESGLPIYLNNNTYKLNFDKEVHFSSWSRKNTEDMRELFYNIHSVNEQEPVYDCYRGIAMPTDRAIFDNCGLRYDITVIMPGCIGGECKKTSGHYHGNIPRKTVAYPEIYEVIKGKALYILQRVSGDVTDSDPVIVEELICAEVNEGQKIIIPPAYGHCSVNIGEGLLVFSNIAVEACLVHYKSIKTHKGMSCYFIKADGLIETVQNPNYKNHVKPVFASVTQCEELGIIFNAPVYKSFINNPEKFSFLLSAECIEDRILSLIKRK